MSIQHGSLASVVGRTKGRWAAFFASMLAGLAVLGYSDTASATWGTCQPYVIYETHTPIRNFQVTCKSGGATVWMMYSTTNEAQAARFQSLMTAAILGGHYVRADLVTDATLCAGIAQTCRKATTWSLSTVPNP